MTSRIRAVVFDLDGVLRHWSREETAEVERRYDIASGSIHEAAFTDIANRAVIGEVTDEQWRENVAELLRARYGVAGAEAAREWAQRTGVVDHDMVALVRRLRQAVTVALLTNATTRLPGDLSSQGLDREFDLVFNSSSIGVAKPNPDVYAFVEHELELTSEQWLFIDDRIENVEAAAAFGVAAHHFSGRRPLETWLQTFIDLDALS